VNTNDLIVEVRQQFIDFERPSAYNSKRLFDEVVLLSKKIELARKVYVDLINNLECADNGDAMYVANRELMDRFDEVFGGDE